MQSPANTFGIVLIALWVGYLVAVYIPITSDSLLWVSIGFLILSFMLSWLETG